MEARYVDKYHMHNITSFITYIQYIYIYDDALAVGYPYKTP